jgi:hypothetical protein
LNRWSFEEEEQGDDATDSAEYKKNDEVAAGFD